MLRWVPVALVVLVNHLYLVNLLPPKCVPLNPRGPAGPTGP